MIDRVAPTRRPKGKPVGYQSWRSLLFMHWPVPVEQLRPLVPSSLELDLHEGIAYVGLVPFAMFHVRPWWAPKSLGFNFLETNVRTYVTVDGRPGVYFFSLDAASRIGVWTARTFWGLPYFYASMKMRQIDDMRCYRSVRTVGNRHHEVSCRVGELLPASGPTSLEFFFLERYLLFLQRRDTLYCGQVHHSPYPAHLAEILNLDDQLLAAAGLTECHGLPPFVHYSPGVDVEIFPLRPI
ncbi:MAG: DUF2071 domain-containing protein [Planctomycetota bacterium]